MTALSLVGTTSTTHFHSLAGIASASDKPILARTVAQALETHLERCSTSVDWVRVIEKDLLPCTPRKEWPAPAPLLDVMLCRGREGMLVYVMAQADPNQPHKVTPLLQIKMLGDYKTVCSELQFIWEFLEHLGDHRIVAKHCERH